MKVGFIGLGQMGAAMARNLVKGGHEVAVWNRSREKAEAFAKEGAKAAADLHEVCQADAVFSMLADDKAARSVVMEPGGVLESLPKGATHMSSSTISVALSDEFSTAHAKAGQGYVSAPVFGRPEAAAAGKLFVVAAGAPDRVAALQPLFDAVGQRTFVLSEEPRTANLIKLSGNFLIACVIESLGEAMALVGKAGVDRAAISRVSDRNAVQRAGLQDLWRPDRRPEVFARRLCRAAGAEGHPACARRRRGARSCAPDREPAARPLPDPDRGGRRKARLVRRWGAFRARRRA